MTHRSLIAALLFMALPVYADKSFVVHPNTPACQSLTPAAVGGPMPPAGILTLRWLGTTNFELDYQGQVILLDAYYDRGPRMRPIGFRASDVKRANAILVGHGHFDHMSDAAQIAVQTGAPVVGAPTVTDTAISLGLPPAQAMSVRGGEVMRYRGFTVEAILAQHSTLAPEVLAAFKKAIEVAAGKPTSSEEAAEAAIMKRGTWDPKVITEGTIAYLFTFDNGFRLICRNSAGPITDAERAVIARIGGKTDVAIVAYIGQYLAERQMAATLPIVELYHPRLYIPAHHDAIAGIFMDMGLEPLFTGIRDEMPGTSYLSLLYREPVCIDVWNGVHKVDRAKR